ncbi:hypothetical protein LTA6_001527 [Microbacterium sp. LTA6]|uniref:hypothetical protein n=1 Tax=Microbacterium sp. LTA6 TaxID=3129771 RepID=UPI00324ADBF9
MSDYGIVKSGTHVTAVPDRMPWDTEAGSPIPSDVHQFGRPYSQTDPADAEEMQEQASKLIALAWAMQSARTTLTKISTATDLGDGDSLDNLRSHAGQFAEQFEPLSDALTKIGSGLLVYGYGIGEIIPKAAKVGERLDELWTPVWNANETYTATFEQYGYGPYQPDSDAEKDMKAAHLALDNAVAAWEGKAERVDLLWNNWIEIHDAANSAVKEGLGDLEWKDVINKVSDDVHKWASWIATYAGIGALVPIPGVQEVLGVVALSAGGVALYISADHVLDGTGTWGEVIADGIGVIPITDIALLKQITKVPGVAEELVKAGGKGLDIDDEALQALLDKWKRDYGHAVRTEGFSDPRIRDSLKAFLEEQGKTIAESRVPEPEYPPASEVEDLRREAERIARRQGKR